MLVYLTLVRTNEKDGIYLSKISFWISLFKDAYVEIFVSIEYDHSFIDLNALTGHYEKKFYFDLKLVDYYLMTLEIFTTIREPYAEMIETFSIINIKSENWEGEFD